MDTERVVSWRERRRQTEREIDRHQTGRQALRWTNIKSQGIERVTERSYRNAEVV